MSNENKTDEILNYLHGRILDVQGRLHANELITNALLKVICENAPILIEEIKGTILDTSELSQEMGEVPNDLERSIFQGEIEQCILRFSLIEESSRYSDTKIEVRQT